MKAIIIKIVFFCVFFGNVHAFAQVGCDPEFSICEDVPLDNEVIFLLIAGTLYGIKKIRDDKQLTSNKNLTIS